MNKALSLLCILFFHAHSFSPTPCTIRTPTFLRYCSVWERRQDVELVLLDVLDSDEDRETMVQPLPATHLPDEMTTLNVYGVQLTRPIHQMIVEKASETSLEKVYGHVAYKPDPESWLGAIGCVAEVLLNAENDEQTRTVLCRGAYRFIVKEVKASVPYPIVVVDELYDDMPTSGAEETTSSTLDDEDDDEDDDEYRTLSPSELEARIMNAMRTYVDQQLEVAPTDMSPLEQSILEDSEFSLSAQRQAAEEMAAVLEVFQQYIVDLCPAPVERYYAVGFLAAELASLSNEVRRDILAITDGVARLRIVCREIEILVGMARARKMANQITKEVDDPQKELQVGQPQLPPWAKNIRKGMKLQYYWNEEFGWCEGEVVADPVLIVDEILLQVYFADDDSTRTLPFSADEKVRWRPAGSSG